MNETHTTYLHSTAFTIPCPVKTIITKGHSVRLDIILCISMVTLCCDASYACCCTEIKL